MPKVSHFNCPDCGAITSFYFNELRDGFFGKKIIECWRCKIKTTAKNNVDMEKLQ